MARIRILLAEDHVVVRESIRKSLEREQDFEVVGEASDGEEAVQLTTKLKPDVVVMDVAMPNVNGIEATKRIKMISPTTAVLALTAYDYDQYIFALLDVGAAGYLLKDVSTRELTNAIRAVYKGDSVLHPAVARKVLMRFRGTPSEHEVLGTLTDREVNVLKIAAKGMSNKDIAEQLSLSTRTIEAHFNSIFNKLGVGSRTEAVVYALKRGWFTLEDLEVA